MWESSAGAAAARQGILRVAVPPSPPSRGSCRGIPVELCPPPPPPGPCQRRGRAAAERGAGVGSAPPRGSSAATPTTPRSLRWPPSKSNRRTPWQRGAGSPRHPETCPSVTTLASALHQARSGRASECKWRWWWWLGSQSGSALPEQRAPEARPPPPRKRVLGSIPSLPPSLAVPGPARAPCPPPHPLPSPTPPRAAPSAGSPARPTAPRAPAPRPRARARRAGQPSALSWRRGAASVGTGAVPRAWAGRPVAVASSAPAAARGAASRAPAGAARAGPSAGVGRPSGARG